MPRIKLPFASKPRIAGAAALLAACAAGAAAQAQSVRLFTDWQAACDNVKACSALGLGPDGADNFGFVDLRRGGAAGDPPNVSLAFTFETELQELPLELAFDPPMAQSGLPKAARAATGADGMLRYDLPPQNVAAFIAAVRRAEFLRVRRLDDAPDKQAVTSISLKGAAAALRWIDEQQMRAGNVTALAARGDRPASAVPAQVPQPVVPRSSYPAQQIEGRAPPEIVALQKAACPELADAAGGGEIGFRISPFTILWQMPCTRGAYNFSSVYFLQDRRNEPEAVVFARPHNGGLERDLTEIVNGEFSEDDRAIYFFAKNRGLGDCGARGAYVWTGRRFALTSWREMPSCRGAPLDLWPMLWRAEIRAR